MTAKQYLRQLEKIKIRIDHLTWQIKELDERATSLRGLDYSAPAVQTSPTNDASFVSAIVKLSDIKSEVTERIVQYEQIQNKIIKQIERVDNALFEKVLFKRYVELKSYNEIADELQMSISYFHKAHKLALETFGRLFRSEIELYTK